MDSFNRKFGEQLPNGEWQVPARWQSGWVLLSSSRSCALLMLYLQAVERHPMRSNPWIDHQRLRLREVWLPLDGHCLLGVDRGLDRYLFYREPNLAYPHCWHIIRRALGCVPDFDDFVCFRSLPNRASRLLDYLGQFL